MPDQLQHRPAPTSQVPLPSHVLPAPATRRGRIWPWVVGAIVVIGAIIAYVLWQHSRVASRTPEQQSSQQRSVPVVAMAVRTGELPIYLDGLGSITPFNSVTVRSRVDGQLVNVAFKEGQHVNQGDLLAEIDPRPFEATLAQMQGQLAKDQAQLSNAQRDLQRFQQASETVTQQQIDTQAAVVKQNEGLVETDKALVENAKLQLSFCKITSPITGRVGLRLVDMGNIIHANDTNGLVVVNQVQPISLVFTLPQESIFPVLQKTRAGEKLKVLALDRTLTTTLATGELSAIDNQVDPNTGTVRLKATFPNENDALFPNEFVNGRLLVETLKDVTLLPTAAIQHGPNSTFVYAVKADMSVEMRPVALAQAQGEFTVVTKGVAPGEQVVTDGVDKLQQGSKVSVSAPGATTRRSASTAPGAPGHTRK